MKEKVFRFAVLLSLINLLIAVSLGTLIRAIPFLPIVLPARNLIHAHSHVAFLGWVFIALMALIYQEYFSGCRRVIRWFLIYLGVIQISVFGMLATFPFTGYAFGSISFSTIHMIASIFFIFYFRRKSLPGNIYAKQFIGASLIFMVLSSIGPLALGPLSVMGHKSGFLYDSAIYFYLHFQYNGWFTMAIIGLLLSWSDPGFLKESLKKLKWGFWLLLIGIVLSYTLSLVGYRISILMNVIGGIGAMLQLVGFIILWRMINISIGRISISWAKSLLKFSILALLVKFIIQLSTAFPNVIDLTYYNRDWVIAYLHWVLLGFVSTSLIGGMGYTQVTHTNHNWMKTVLFIFILAFLFTEFALLGKNMVFGELYFDVWQWVVFILSFVLLAAVFNILIIVYKNVMDFGSKQEE